MSASLYNVKSIYDLNGLNAIPNAIPNTVSNSENISIAGTALDRRYTMTNRINKGLSGSDKFLCPNNTEITAFSFQTSNNLRNTVCLYCNCDPNYVIVCRNVNDPLDAISVFKTDHDIHRNTTSDTGSESEYDNDSDEDYESESDSNADSDSESDSEYDNDSDTDYEEGYSLYYPSDSDEE
jgi:hypothetical protein